MKRWVGLWFGIGVVVGTAFSQNASLPKPEGWVSDFANVMDAESRDGITAVAQELKEKTGVELAVVTVKDMDGAVIEDYAVRLFGAWEIGQKGKDNGALLILAMEERKVRIEVGYDLEPVLTSGRCGGILDTYVMPEFRNGEWGKGLYRGILAMTSLVAKDRGVVIEGTGGLRAGEGSEGGSGTGKIIAIVLFILLVILTKGRIIPWMLLGSMMGGGSKGGSWGGGFGRGGGFGGGFGGFGGGRSGGGGASRGF